MSEEVINLYDELPDFANKENRNIHTMIIKKNAELQNIQTECQELKSRVSSLSLNYNKFQNEIDVSQRLLTTRIGQVEEEKHLQQLCDRESSKLLNQLTNLKHKTDDVLAMISAVNHKINIAQKRIDMFKAEEKLNQEDLEQWINVARQKEEDFLILRQYQKDDEKHLKSIMSDIEGANKIINSKNAELEKEVTTTRSLQNELNIIADHFRQMHAERERLLQQWEKTLQQMQNLNESIEKRTQDYEMRKIALNELEQSLLNHKQQLVGMEESNQQLDREISSKDGLIVEKHQEFEKESVLLSTIKESVETQKYQLEQLERDCHILQEEINNYKEKIAQEKARKEGYMVRLEHSGQKALAQNEQENALLNEAQSINAIVTKEEEELKQLEENIEQEKQFIFKLTQDIYQSRKNEKDLVSQIQDSQSQLKTLVNCIKDYDREAQKQLQVLYSTNFQIQGMEKKIGRCNGERSEEEKIEIQNQIDHLSTVLEEKIKSSKLLNDQVNQLELDMKATKKKKEELEKFKSDLSVQLKELHLDQDSIDKAIQEANTQKENVLVDLNMKKIQIEKLNEQIKLKNNQCLSQDNENVELRDIMMERIKEIDSHLQALRSQMMSEEQSKHEASLELNELKKQSTNLQSKYQVMIGKFEQGDEGNIETPYYVVKYAKEREEINQRGDELEEEVRIAIKELRGLEKAMEKLSGLNRSLKSSFRKSRKSERLKIEDQLIEMQNNLTDKKAELEKVTTERMNMEQRYESQQQKITKYQGEIGKMKPIVEKIGNENKAINEKLKKASFMFSKAKDENRKKSNENLSQKYPATKTEMNVEYQILKKLLDDALRNLSTLCENNKDIQQKVMNDLKQIGLSIAIPTKPVSKPATIVKPKPSPALITSSRSASAMSVLNRRTPDINTQGGSPHRTPTFASRTTKVMKKK